MRAVLFEAFFAPPRLTNVPDPVCEPHGIILRPMATGVCRSDWHGWQGHDSDVVPPHVPGHETAGVIEAVGKDVRRWKVGDRVTVPFVGGCGACGECHSGNQQVCDHQFQPGFTHWGAFAELVSLHYADVNLVALPESMAFETAASLGCRFATAFRAVVDQGRARPGEWVAVHGCGGVGLSAVMIASALGAQVVAVDLADDKLELARQAGACVTINARTTAGVVEAVQSATGGGAHLSLDALGHPVTLNNSILNLRKRGRHVQVGLMGEHANPAIPMGKVIAHEIELLGSHGMQAHRYGAMMQMIEQGVLKPELLVGARISLEQSIEALVGMDRFAGVGTTVITRF